MIKCEVPWQERNDYDFHRTGRRWTMLYKGESTEFEIEYYPKDGLCYPLDGTDEPIAPATHGSHLSETICMNTHYQKYVVPTLEEIGSER